MKAKLIKTNPDKPITKPGILFGKYTAYWTRDGITLFVFDHEYESAWSKNHELVDAVPGMVGIDFDGSQVYLILSDGEAHMIGSSLGKYVEAMISAVNDANAEARESHEEEIHGG